jgi:hypothetical protein
MVGFTAPRAVEVRSGGDTVEVEYQYDPASGTITLTGIPLDYGAPLAVTVRAEDGTALAKRGDARLAQVRRLLAAFRMESWTRLELSRELAEVVSDPARLAKYAAAMQPSQIRAMMETITGAGMDYTESTGDPLIVVWNNHGDENVQHFYALARVTHSWQHKEHYPSFNGPAPRFLAYKPKAEFGENNPWRMGMNYYGFGEVKLP